MAPVFKMGNTNALAFDKIGFQNGRLRLGKTTCAELRVGDFTVNALTLKTQAITSAGGGTTAAVTANTIKKNVSLVLVTSGGVNTRVHLPSPADVSLGHTIEIHVGATGCELGSLGDGTTATTINAVAVTDAAGAATAVELALGAETVTKCIKVGANKWAANVSSTSTAD